GKTMVVQSLSLLFGGRSDAGLVRAGAPRSSVEGTLRVDPASPAALRVLDAGGLIEDGELLLARTTTAEGRSRAHAGGRAIPVSVLAELGSSLFALHGQHDQQALVRPAEQRAALDRFGGDAVGAPLAHYRSAFARWREVTAAIEEISTAGRERAQEADALRFGLAQIDAADPVAGEDAALSLEVQRLGHAEDLATSARAAHDALIADPGADEPVDATLLVAQARRSLAQAAEHDPTLGALADRLADLSYQLADVAADLASYADSVEDDPARLAAVHERQAALAALVRRYGPDVDAVLEWAQAAAARLLELDGDDERIASLAEEQRALVRQLTESAAAVSAARTAAAADFAVRVSAELEALAMPEAVITADVRQEEVSAGGLEYAGRRVAFGPDGIDSVELLLVPHAGAPARALHRGASGGELSRVMLAVEVVFAEADPVPTMVFDEVDAGVGGRAAVEIGRRLAQLARSHQVVVVTHLPQVAAFADRHLVVRKSGDGTVTASDVVTLDDDGRVRELSRMLAGLEDSALARGHAEELLAAAAATRG
ncbi:MAG: repair protein RecN, partial [Frankiaceae bacterium]|nr:repair protein RecN [Frankiaceae bacterium]